MSETSPCQGICKLINDMCIGCYRTAFEVRFWLKFDDIRKREIKTDCENRKLIFGEMND